MRGSFFFRSTECRQNRVFHSRSLYLLSHKDHSKDQTPHIQLISTIQTEKVVDKKVRNEIVVRRQPSGNFSFPVDQVVYVLLGYCRGVRQVRYNAPI